MKLSKTLVWSLALREEHRLNVFVNRALKTWTEDGGNNKRLEKAA
jgi:hypothetical protein